MPRSEADRLGLLAAACAFVVNDAVMGLTTKTR
jgi:hypothetical protein